MEKAVKTVKANPLAMAEAIRLAKGDRSRLEILPDGAVMVHNTRAGDAKVRRRIVTRRPHLSPKAPPITQDY